MAGFRAESWLEKPNFYNKITIATIICIASPILQRWTETLHKEKAIKANIKTKFIK